MSKAKFLIQLPLLLLGACVPIQPQPQPNIAVYVITDGSTDDVGARIHPPKPPRVQTQVDGRTIQQSSNGAGHEENVVCKRVHEGTYELPKLPDLSQVPEGNDDELIRSLVDHIEALRQDLKDATIRCKASG